MRKNESESLQKEGILYYNTNRRIYIQLEEDLNEMIIRNNAALREM